MRTRAFLPRLFAAFFMLVMPLAFTHCGLRDPSSSTAKVEKWEMVTNERGAVELAPKGSKRPVEVNVENETGAPLSGARVIAVADQQQLILFVHDPSGQHYPAVEWVAFDRPEAAKFAFPVIAVPIVLKAVKAALAAYAGYTVYQVVSRPGMSVESGSLQKECKYIKPREALTVLSTLAYPLIAKTWIAKVGDPVKTTLLETKVLAGVLGIELAAHLHNFFDTNIPLPWCEYPQLRAPDGQPLIVEIGPVEIASLETGLEGVEVSIYATGNVTGHVATLDAHNQTLKRETILLYPGLSFQNASSGNRQDMTVIRTVSGPLDPGQRRSLEVHGACIHASKGAPRTGDVFIPFAEQRPDLLLLGQAIDLFAPEASITQRAVWAITDEVVPSCTVFDTVVRLFVNAGLNPAHYPALDPAHCGPGAPLRSKPVKWQK